MYNGFHSAKGDDIQDSYDSDAGPPLIPLRLNEVECKPSFETVQAELKFIHSQIRITITVDGTSFLPSGQTVN